MAAREVGAMEQNELVVSRVIDAPRDVVWKAWTEPEQVKKWWGPKGFTAPSVDADFREGGKYLYCMRSPDGQDYWSTGIYKEISEPERIVATDSFADEKGNPVPASHYGMPEADGMPMETTIEVTFEDQDGKTKVTIKHVGMPAGTASEMAGQGWKETLDKLAEVVSA
ncbi:MAG: SRPBCC domain-containing protein [Actinomycetota bacterium]